MAEPRMTTRAAVAAVHLQLLQLLEIAGVVSDDGDDLTSLTINVNYGVGRIDIARLTPDGQHIAEWLCAFSIDPTDLPRFGTPIGLPGTSERAH